MKTFATIILCLLAPTVSIFAHPGHDMTHVENAGHFLTSPYHVATGLVIFIVFLVLFIKRKKIRSVFVKK